MRSRGFQPEYQKSDTDFKGQLGYIVPFCNSSCRAETAETVPRHFSGLLGIKSRQIFTLILAQLHILTSLQMPGIPTLTKVASTHLPPNRGYNRSHCQMTGRTSKKPEPPQTVISQGSQATSSSYCLQSSHPPHILGIVSACHVSHTHFQNKAGSQIFGLVFQ